MDLFSVLLALAIGGGVMWLIDTWWYGRVVRQVERKASDELIMSRDDAYGHGYEAGYEDSWHVMTRQLQEAGDARLPDRETRVQPGSSDPGGTGDRTAEGDGRAGEVPPAGDGGALPMRDVRPVALDQQAWDTTPQELSELRARYYDDPDPAARLRADWRTRSPAAVGQGAGSGAYGPGVSATPPHPGPAYAYDPTWFPRGEAFIGAWRADAMRWELAADEALEQWVAESHAILAAAAWPNRMLEASR